MGLFTSLVDTIFPPRCVNCGKTGAYFCLECFHLIRWVEQPICPYCKRNAMEGHTHPYCRKKLGLDGLSSAFYFTGPIKKSIHQLKYQLITNLSEELGLLTVTSFRKQGIRFQDFEVVPVPLFILKQNHRGFNQGEILAQKLIREWDLPLNRALKRTKNTKTQASLFLKERFTNLKEAFEVVGEVKDKRFLVVDDVFTTGATLFSAAEVLKRAGAKKVWGLTLARSQSY